MPTHARLALHTTLQGLARLIAALLGGAATALVARGLGRVDFGYFATSLAAASLFSFATDLGVTQVAAKETVEHSDSALGIVRVAVRSRMILALPMAGISLLLVIPQPERMILPGALLAATIPVGSLNAYQALFIARKAPLPVGVASLIQSVTWTGSAAICYVSNAGPVLFGATFLLSTLLQSITLAAWAEVTSRASDANRPTSLTALGLLKLSRGVGLAAVLWSAMQRAPLFLVTWIAGPAQAGLLGAASRMLDAVYLFPTTASSTLLPLLIERRDAEARARRVVSAAVNFCLFAGAIVFVNAYTASPALAASVFGKDYSGLGPVLTVTLLTVVPFGLDCIWGTALLSVGRTYSLAHSAVYGLLVTLVAALSLVAPFGALGAAISLLAGQTFRAFMLGRRARQYVGAGTYSGWISGVVTFTGSAAVAVAANLVLEVGTNLGRSLVVCGVTTVFVIGLALATGLIKREDLSHLRS